MLLAGTQRGLYACDIEDEQWTSVPLGENESNIRSIVRIRDSILVFTDSEIWRCAANDPGLAFEEEPALRLAEPNGKAGHVSLVFLLFDLHSGSILGLLGKLLFDLVGLTTVFLSVSAFYLWFYPWRRRKRARAPRDVRAKPHAAAGLESRRGRRRVKPGQKSFRLLFKYHLKIGIWIAPILLLMSATGLFMRPPLLILPAMWTVPASMYPERLRWNPGKDASIAPRTIRCKLGSSLKRQTVSGRRQTTSAARSNP